jgi:hypothetical protein
VIEAACLLDLSLASSYLIGMRNSNHNFLSELSLQQLQQAVAIRERIEDLEKELDRIVGAQPSPTKAPAPRRKRRFSAAARAKLSASMKARWATRKGKRRLSAKSGRVGKARGLTTANAKKAGPVTPLKDQIVGTLKSAGKSGATFKNLTAKIGKSYGNISVWFHTTGKGMKEIKKVEPGRFAWAS